MVSHIHALQVTEMQQACPAVLNLQLLLFIHVYCRGSALLMTAGHGDGFFFLVLLLSLDKIDDNSFVLHLGEVERRNDLLQVLQNFALSP